MFIVYISKKCHMGKHFIILSCVYLSSTSRKKFYLKLVQFSRNLKYTKRRNLFILFRCYHSSSLMKNYIPFRYNCIHLDSVILRKTKFIDTLHRLVNGIYDEITLCHYCDSNILLINELLPR